MNDGKNRSQKRNRKGVIGERKCSLVFTFLSNVRAGSLLESLTSHPNPQCEYCSLATWTKNSMISQT
jgi:hypothetical protein